MEFEYPALENVSLDRHALLDRAWGNLNHLTVDPDTHLYFYAALDLRLYIESLLLELVAAAKGNSLSARERTMYKAKDFSHQLLTSTEVSIERLSMSLFGASLSRADLDNLVAIYGKLGAFLHLPKSPYFSAEQTEWKGKLEEFIGDTYQLLESLDMRLRGQHR